MSRAAESPGEDATFLLQQGLPAREKSPVAACQNWPPILITEPTNEIANTTGNTSIPSTGASIANSVPTTGNAIGCCNSTGTTSAGGVPLAKMDVLEAITFIQPGIYHLIPAIGPHLAKMDVLSQKCHVIPMT